jgi:hypothetical protein
MASPNQAHFSGATSAGGTATAEKARETSNISRLNPNQLKNQEQIIHRTKNCIIVAGQNKRDDQEPVGYTFQSNSIHLFVSSRDMHPFQQTIS